MRAFCDMLQNWIAAAPPAHRAGPEPGSAEGIEDLLANAVESLRLSHWESDQIERVQAAIVIGGKGDLARVRDMKNLALSLPTIASCAAAVE